MNFFKTLFNPSYGYARGIVAMILGIILIIYPTSSIKFMVWVIGGVVTLSGIVSLCTYALHRNKKGGETIDEYSSDRLLLISGIAATVIGLVLLLFSNVLINFIVCIFGILLTVMAVMQFINFIKASKSQKNSLYLYLFPVATLVLGIICTLQPQGTAKGAVILLGVGILVAGVSEFMSVLKLGKALRTLREKERQ